MPTGYLALVLHSHLPFVRHPEHDRFLEEDWFFEAVSETYLPLLRVFENLVRDGVPFRITISISPTLAAMLQDELLQERYLIHLDRLIRFAENEVDRTRGNSGLKDLARLYLNRYQECRSSFEERYHRDLLTQFKQFQDQGMVELIATSATHCFLPMFQVFPQGVKTQIRVGAQAHARTFGSSSRGFWLPECGYYPGLEELLKECGASYFFLEAHGILFADSRPVYGVYAPLSCPNGLAAFGRDPESAKAVWSAEEGYPGHPIYREFYRDVGFDLPLERVQPFLHDGGLRAYTGIKYWAITGPTEKKVLYNLGAAQKKVAEDAEHFLASRIQQAERIAPWIDRPPLIVCAYDAELFGHWWFEGPEWVETLLRKVAAAPEKLALITASDYLALHPEGQTSQPAFSSWGNKGFAEVWLDGTNDWIYRHTHKAVERMADLARRFSNEKGTLRRALNQAAREVLLSQASDWAFILKTGTTVPYALKRIREHIYNFNRLYESILATQIDQEWLSRVEKKNNLFPHLDYRVFQS